jgi:hypothetical protein
MKKVKIAYWVTIFVLLLLLFVQNQDFFMQKVSLSWNIISIDALAKLEWKWFIDYKTPEWSQILFFLIYFAAGVVLTLIYKFFTQMKYGRTISSLNRTCKLHLNKISELERELASFRSGFPGAKEDVIDISKDDDTPDKKKLKEKK